MAAPARRSSAGELVASMPSGPSVENVELRRARRLGAPVGEVDDLALLLPLDRRVRLVDEALQAFRQPVIAARLPAIAVHALLHHDPVAVVGDDEAVQVEIEAVLHRGAVDLGDQPARSGQRRAVERRRARRSPPARPASAANAGRARRRRGGRARLDSGARPRLSAPMTLVVMPEECQSIPITAPNDWNQNGCASRRSSSSRP